VEEMGQEGFRSIRWGSYSLLDGGECVLEVPEGG
jgi:hypothetical protein